VKYLLNLDLINLFLIQALTIGTVYLIATLGEVLSERAGVVNLGLEGLMEIGATVAIIVALITENAWLGILAAFVAAAALATVHAFATVSLKLNQFASGLAIYIFGVGIGVTFRGYARDVILGPQALLKIPKIKAAFTSIKIPGLSNIPVIGSLFSLDVMAYFGLFLGILLWFIFYRTRTGLNIRSVGENPAAADAAGINVFRLRYITTIIGGGLAGVAGGYLIIKIATQIAGETVILGRGWIAIALVIFAFWDPLRAIIGAYFFGALEALFYWLQGYFGGATVVMLKAVPHISAIIILTIMSIEALRKRIGAPEALGKPYSRE